MKKEKEKNLKEPEETKEQLIQSNQIMETQLRILEEEASLREVERYRRQHLILLNEQNQILKGIGLALNRIGIGLENSKEEGDEETEEEEVADVEEEPEIEKTGEEVVKEMQEEENSEEEEVEEEPKPLSKEEEKIQKKMDKLMAKLKKAKKK